MKKFAFLALLSVATAVSLVEEQKIVVVTASYNNKQWYKQSLDSIFAQNYDNWHLIYIDDCSPDGTGDLVDDYIMASGQAEHVTLIKNKKRKWALNNQYDAICSCNDQAIIIIVDGDDFLAHSNVFAYINNVYLDSRVWLTYGQFKCYPSGARGFCAPMPDTVVRYNLFRQYHHIPSHLRSFKAWLFKQIKKEDLMYKGSFMHMTGDAAAMIPMIEMARDNHFRFLPEISYIYNEVNSLNDHKVSKKLQYNLDLHIRGMRAYAALDTPIDYCK